MKKIFTLLCAISFLFGANAAPRFAAKAALNNIQKKEQVLNAKNAQRKAQMNSLRQAQDLKKGQIVTANKVRKGQAETFDIEITTFAFQFYSDDNSVYYGLRDENGLHSFYFSIFLPEGQRDVELDKTYTLDDMDPRYCEWDDTAWVEHPYVVASFKKTIGSSYDVTIEASVTDSLGDTYNLLYKEEPLVITGDTIELDFTTPMTNIDYLSDGTWRLATSDSISAQINFFSSNDSSCAGVFSTEQFDLQNTFVQIPTGEIDEYDDPIYNTWYAKEASAAVIETDARIDASAVILASDGNVYKVNMWYVKPFAESFETITADLVIDDWAFGWFGEVELSAADDKNSIRLFIAPEGLGEALAGSYVIGQNGCSGSVAPADAEDAFDIYSGSFDITFDNGNINLAGKVLCTNNVEYTLNLTYTKPVASRQETITITDAELSISDFGWEAAGYTADGTKYLSISVESEQINGHFTQEDIDSYYTYVAELVDSSVVFFDAVDADFDVVYNETDGTISISGTLLCQSENDATDVVEYTFTLTGTKTNPFAYDDTEDFIVNFPEYTKDFDYLQYGVIYVEAEDGENTIGLQVWLPEGAEDVVAGTYPITAEPAYQSVQASEGINSNGNITYSMAGKLNAEGYFTRVWFIVEGNVVVKEDGVIEVDALNSNGKVVRCRLGSGADGLEDLEGNNARISKRLIDGRLIIERNGVRYNALGTVVK